MKVLFIRANPVRPDSRVEKEVAVLNRLGYEVSVLCWDRSDNYPLRVEPLNETDKSTKAYRIGIKTGYGLGMKNLKYLIRFQKEIRFFLKLNRFDVVHACDFDTAFTAFHSIDQRCTKFIYDIFDYYVDAFPVPSLLKRIVIAFDRQIINNADVVIICSEQRRKQIAGSQPKELIVIHNSPSNSITFHDDIEVKENSVIKIAYFGVLTPGRLIKEMIEVVSENTQYELHIGGFGVLEKLVNDAASKFANIKYYGTVPYKKVLDIEHKCDILTAIYDPSLRNHHFAAPNKFYESLMLGKPVVMVKHTGMSDVVEEYNIGTTIVYSKEGLKNGLDKLAKKRQEWPIMALKMTQLYSTAYSWAEMERRLIAVYKRLEQLIKINRVRRL